MTCHHLITPTRAPVPCVQCTGNWPGQLLFKQPGPPSDSWLFKVHENFFMQKLCTLSHTMIILTITPPITLLTEIKRKPTLLLIFKVLHLTASALQLALSSCYHPWDVKKPFFQGWKNQYYTLLYRHECFTGKYTTCKIHKNYIRDPKGLFSIISHVSLSMM